MNDAICVPVHVVFSVSKFVTFGGTKLHQKRLECLDIENEIKLIIRINIQHDVINCSMTIMTKVQISKTTGPEISIIAGPFSNTE